jgi:hypothetical protein
MLDPAAIIPYLWLEPLDRTRQAGREAIRVRGLPRREVVEELSPTVLRLGADEYELLVDAERGMFFRYIARLDGKVFAGREVLGVAVDTPFLDVRFFPDLPPETDVQHVADARPPQIGVWCDAREETMDS